MRVCDLHPKTLWGRSSSSSRNIDGAFGSLLQRVWMVRMFAGCGAVGISPTDTHVELAHTFTHTHTLNNTLKG